MKVDGADLGDSNSSNSKDKWVREAQICKGSN